MLSSAWRRVHAAFLADEIRAGTNVELAGFIQRTAERVAIDALRHRRQDELSRRQGIPWQGAMPAPSDASDEIAAVVRHCDEDERFALQLHAHGLCQRQIAEALGIGFEAQRSRWRRLLAKLRAGAFDRRDAHRGRP